MRNGARRLFIGVIALVAIGGLGTLYISQARESEPPPAGKMAVETTSAAASPHLRVATVADGPKQRDVTLLADVRPYATTTMYAKLGGYLKNLPVDRGDQVKAGQIVAEIDSQETDHQYTSAMADLENKKRLAIRSREMAATGTASKQTLDNAETALRMAEAAVRQVATLRSYETIRAPFDGTVTARFADPGVLIENASTNQSSALPMMIISDTSKLRVTTYVEQEDAMSVTVGMPVDVVDSTNPDRKMVATVSRTSGSLDPKTRTLTIEIDLDNSQDFLASGSFAQVTLHLPMPPYPQVPTAALMTRNDATIVACLDEQNQIHFRPVRIASAGGNLTRIAEGLQVGDRVVLNLPDDVADGTKIEPIVATAPAR
jgi:RND family efflux transporter MFP subunit